MKTKWLVVVVLIAVVFQLTYSFEEQELWWDEGVYVGMGKYLFSAGNSGLWEHVRPPVLPVLLGLLWKTGLPIILFGKLVQLVMFIGIILLTYSLSKKWFSEKIAILSTIIIAFSTIFHNLSVHSYTEIPAVFFVLLGLWFYEQQQNFLSGISIGLGFLAKFPAGMFIIVIAVLLAKRKQALLKLVTGFSIIVLPYLLYSWVFYGNPFATLLAARSLISQVLGCNVLHHQPWYYYFKLLFDESKLYIFAIPGLIILFRKWNREKLVYVLSLTIPLLYFVQLQCRDYRYLTLFLPFVAMLAALGIVWLFELMFRKRKAFFLTIPVIILVLAVYTLMSSYAASYTEPMRPAEHYFKHTLSSAGEIWVANPLISIYTDRPVNKIYYPIYNQHVSEKFMRYVQQYPLRIGAVYLDNCGGGIICAPEDQSCEQQTKKLIERLDSTFRRTYDEQQGRCWFTIWEP